MTYRLLGYEHSVDEIDDREDEGYPRFVGLLRQAIAEERILDIPTMLGMWNDPSQMTNLKLRPNGSWEAEEDNEHNAEVRWKMEGDVETAWMARVWHEFGWVLRVHNEIAELTISEDFGAIIACMEKYKEYPEETQVHLAALEEQRDNLVDRTKTRLLGLGTVDWVEIEQVLAEAEARPSPLRTFFPVSWYLLERLLGVWSAYARF